MEHVRSAIFEKRFSRQMSEPKEALEVSRPAVKTVIRRHFTRNPITIAYHSG
jgi:hypothetical protein